MRSIVDVRDGQILTVVPGIGRVNVRGEDGVPDAGITTAASYGPYLVSKKVTIIGDAAFTLTEFTGDMLDSDRDNINIREVTGDYTLVADDRNTLLVLENTEDVTITVPADIFTLKTSIAVVRWNTGNATIEAGDGVSIRSVDNLYSTNDLYQVVNLTHVKENEWLLGGAN